MPFGAAGQTEGERMKPYAEMTVEELNEELGQLKAQY